MWIEIIDILCYVDTDYVFDEFLFQSLRLCSEELRSGEDDSYMTAFWIYEFRRVFSDKISQPADLEWFEDAMKTTIKKVRLSHSFVVFLYPFW